MDINNPLEYIPAYFKVLTKADRQNQSDLVPMKLWASQKFYLEHRTHRDIILKNRQAGLSTGIMAANAHQVFTKPYQSMTIVTHDQETSEYLFLTFQRFHRLLPVEIRPKTDWRSGARMRFPKLDSYVYIDSAKSDNLGIGHSLNIAHLSEVAKWPHRKAEDLYTDISQTVPEGGYITAESTPKGRGGLFHRLYSEAKEGKNSYKTFFFPWWWDITCVREAGKMEWTKEEKQLIASFNLSPEQIAFRREKIAELGDRFYQEYPENDVDCWLSSEISVFDGTAIRAYLQQILPGKQEGDLTIWKDVLGGEKYVIGVDMAGGKEKGDWSVASVLHVKRNEYVARLRAKIPPDFFAEQVLKLGYRYNQAEIGVEKAQHGHTALRILLENNYPNLYYYRDYDIFLGGEVKEPGWKTTIKTKPIMVDSLAATLRAGDIMLWSENFCLEASSYIWEGNSATHSSGAHDDELDAVMIALQLREQTPIIESGREKPYTYAPSLI